MRNSNTNTGGWYVMGRTQSVAWFPTRLQAERHCGYLNQYGGTTYRVESGDTTGQTQRALLEVLA